MHLLRPHSSPPPSRELYSGPDRRSHPTTPRRCSDPVRAVPGKHPSSREQFPVGVSAKMRELSKRPGGHPARSYLDTYATPTMPSLGLGPSPGHSPLGPTRRRFTWPHKLWRRGSTSASGVPALPPARSGTKAATASSPAVSGRASHSPRAVLCPSPGGRDLPSVPAFRPSVSLPDGNAVLQGRGPGDVLSRAPEVEDAGGPTARWCAACPSTDCSCSPMGTQF